MSFSQVYSAAGRYLTFVFICKTNRNVFPNCFIEFSVFICYILHVLDIDLQRAAAAIRALQIMDSSRLRAMNTALLLRVRTSPENLIPAKLDLFVLYVIYLRLSC